MPAHLADPITKLRTGLATVGWRQTLAGLARLTFLKVVRPHIVEIELKDGLRLRFAYPAQMPTALVAFGDYVDPEYNFLTHIVLPGDRIVDVGGGIGTFALPMARRGAVVDVYEPVLANANTLMRNAIDNGLGTIRLHPLALSDEDVRLSTGTAALNPLSGEGDAMPWTTLDAEFPTARLEVLKVNTAGSEVAVLRSGTTLLRERRAHYLVLLLSEALIAYLPTLAGYGYRIFYWHPQRREKVDLADLDRTTVLHRQPWPARHILAEAR
jgi:FkbM family methyltransferase